MRVRPVYQDFETIDGRSGCVLVEHRPVPVEFFVTINPDHSFLSIEDQIASAASAEGVPVAHPEDAPWRPEFGTFEYLGDMPDGRAHFVWRP